MELFRRILVPHDFSPSATHALEIATGLARAHRGRLLVLHVIGPFHPATALPIEAAAWVPEPELVEGERRRLEALVARTVGRRNAPPVVCRIVIGDPYHRITDAARGADSIVMATAGRTGLSRILIGSVAEKIVRHAPVPVLTVRAPTAARRRGARSARRTRGR